MQFTNEQILLIIAALTALATVMNGIMTSLGAAIGSWITARRAAKKDELTRLTARVDKLQELVDHLQFENDQLREQNILLKEYVSILRVRLKEKGIDVPSFEDWLKDNDE